MQLVALAAVTLAGKATLSPAFSSFPPSAVAAACLVRAREGLGVAPAWPSALMTMTGYALAPDTQLRHCVEVMALLGF